MLTEASFLSCPGHWVRHRPGGFSKACTQLPSPALAATESLCGYHHLTDEPLGPDRWVCPAWGQQLSRTHCHLPSSEALPFLWTDIFSSSH